MNWTRGSTIGRGSSATVYVATATHSDLPFAVKSAELSHSDFLQKEQRILSPLSCPQIVGYRGFDITCENGKVLYNLFLDYAPGGTLLDVIEKHGGRLTDSMIRSYTRSVLLGLNYLHSNGIVHCDIKGQNILVDGDVAIIADLGCARKVDEKLVAPSIEGTPLYMAPEVARGEHQGFAADIWALGCTIVQMASGQPPWAGISDAVSVLYEVGFSGNVPQIPSSMSEQGQDLVSKCLERDPRKRWSATQLLHHDFLITCNDNYPAVVDGRNKGVDDTNRSKSNVGSGSSPTSVLEQGQMWNSMDEDSVMSWSSNSHSNNSSSAMQRVGELGGGLMQMPHWAADDSGWMTVRSSEDRGSCNNNSDEGSSTVDYWVINGEENIVVIPNYKGASNRISGICATYYRNTINITRLTWSIQTLVLLQLMASELENHKLQLHDDDDVFSFMIFCRTDQQSYIYTVSLLHLHFSGVNAFIN